MTRRWLVAAGGGVLAAATLAPWHHVVPAFSAHMLAHTAIVAIAAPLVALGAAGGRLDPVARRPAWFPPVTLSIVELVVVWAWHAPVLHHAARAQTALSIAEQGSFFVCALAVWLAAFGGTGDRADRRAAGLLALLLTSMHMTLLGALLALSPRALYGHAHHGLADQHAGGAIMLLGSGIAYIVGGIALAVDLLRARTATR